MPYFNWMEGEPDLSSSSCISVTTDGEWKDEICSLKKSFICERDIGGCWAECAMSEKRKSFICERDIGGCWAECAMNEKRKSFICERGFFSSHS